MYRPLFRPLTHLRHRSLHTTAVAFANRDFYEVLGLSRDAKESDIKKAYYKKAKQYHPDANKDDKEAVSKFQEVNEAYEVLKDEKKRAAYDTFGHAAANDPNYANYANHTNARDFGGSGGFEDIFEQFSQMFQGGFRPSGQAGVAASRRQGADIQLTLQLGFMEAITGVKKQVTYTTQTKCKACGGSGSKDSKDPMKCPLCGGTGMHTVEVMQGFFSQAACPRCGGEGSVIGDPCSACSARGRTRERRTVQVTVPPGVDSGHRLRLTGRGDAGERGGGPGNLFVQLKVKPHAHFRRDGNDIHVDVPIDMHEAVLGTTARVPTVDGPIDLKIPASTQPGDRQMLRGKGVPHLKGNSRGNQFVHLKVSIPHDLTPRMKELMEEFQEETLKARGKLPDKNNS